MAFAQQPRRLAERERLTLGQTPLTAVIAPAGFGKSTLIEGWRARATPQAYGTFDAFFRTNARDAGLVLTGCAHTLGVAEDTVAEAIGLLAPDGDGLGAEFVTRLAQALNDVSGPYVCFLDDLHGLSEAAARDVGRLISAVADQQHRFVVASRVDLPWPVERWRVNGFADVVTADQLRLTADEIAQLLRPESAHLAPVAHRVTGGWPAAVEVIRWRLATSPNLDLDLETEVLDLVDYVVAEVLPALPEAELRVLTRTAILRDFPASVAIAVSGEPAAPGILFDAHRRTSLITVLDDGRYAYHAVLRAALHRQLTHTEPELEQRLQQRAAEAWLDEPDSFTALSSAVDHLIAGRTWTDAIELLRRRLVQIDRNARLDRFVGWLDAIPGQQWRDDVEMVLQYSYANLRIGRSAQAIDVLQDPVVRKNEHAAAVAKLTYAWTTGWVTDPEEALRLCGQARPALTALDDVAERGGIPQFPGVARFELAADIAAGQAHAILGQCDRAIATLQRVLRHRSEIAPVQLPVVCGALSFALALRGEVAAAKAQAEQALQLAADAGLVNHHVRTVPARLGLATVAAITGDLDTALATLQDAAERCRPLRAANLLAACGQIAALCGVSHSYLADVEPPLTAAAVPIVEQLTIAVAARDRSRLGDHAGAERLLRSTAPHEVMLGTWVEILLHRTERRTLRRWLARLDKPSSRHAQIVRLLAEAAVAESASEASRRTAAAAELASEGHLIGVLMNAPAQLWRSFDAEHSPHPMIIETMTKLDGPALLSEQLTSRELEVLRLFPYIGTAGELAARLFVSENTANWHRRNIYRKLGVHRRSEAVARGVELGLIAPGSQG
ncbi:LuxR C-terminal-related transcriptional regulator [Micropruina sp.]|uniref:helix-turn-helix transcriptional regulator n=1 Tax=Micropruina sp. TaxID=2737536 RepID=UPI00260A4261|nr:LuxR C-terminal-related transcriptional regulator [Micropruina sp.]